MLESAQKAGQTHVGPAASEDVKGVSQVKGTGRIASVEQYVGVGWTRWGMYDGQMELGGGVDGGTVARHKLEEKHLIFGLGS